MKALLKRMWFLGRCTVGELFLDGEYYNYILEDIARVNGVKVPGTTCIPSGLDYKIGKVFSPKFGKIVPVIYTHIIGNGLTPDDFEIQDPVGLKWAAVEMHPGNTDVDSDGCQLPGTKMSVPAQCIYNSKIACDKLYPKIFSVLDAGDTIEYQIINSTPDQAHDYKAV